MDKNEFWNLIQEAYKEADWATDKQMEILIDRLSKYTQEEILKFGKIYEIYAKESYKKKLWAAAYVMNGGCSDDCFDYFRGWLISRGEEPYLNALLDPDFLADLDIPYDDEYFENEQMLSVPLLAFNKNIGSDDLDTYYERIREFELESDEIFDIIDTISFGEDIDENWDENNLESVVPNLYKLYW
ncbi:DUF4240 domain-containing protein [Methanobrevibacter cuticularis]|nr:DUF4240 domain-containing protein [Methanobrevibacter cuticularis]